MILKYDFWILKKYYIKTIRFIINNFIFQIIHSYFAHTTKYKNHIIQKYMKSYFIFTIVLTVAYLVYYAVIIVQDLYGKKGNGKPEEEVFHLPGKMDTVEESLQEKNNKRKEDIDLLAVASEEQIKNVSSGQKVKEENTEKIVEFQEILERLIAQELHAKDEGEDRWRSLDAAIRRQQMARKEAAAASDKKGKKNSKTDKTCK